MKKMTVFMSVVLVLTFAAIALAQGGIGAFCTANGDFGVGHSTCVSCFAAETGGDLSTVAVCMCKLFDPNHTFFRTQGLCVTAVCAELGCPD